MNIDQFVKKGENTDQDDEGGKNIITEMTRTKSGQLLTVTQGGLDRIYAYDGRFRLKRMSRPETRDVVYRYDENGNRISKTIEGLGETTYGYDGRDNLVSINYPDTNVLNSDYVAQDEFEENTLLMPMETFF